MVSLASTIALGADHGGWGLKEELKNFIRSLGYAVDDCSRSTAEAVDYPDVGVQVVQRVLENKAERGLLLCGTGQGMAMTANRFPGIRAALCQDTFSARMSRAHNDANILVLGGRVLGPSLAEDIVRIWLETPFEAGRHARRLAKIEEIAVTICKEKNE